MCEGMCAPGCVFFEFAFVFDVSFAHTRKVSNVGERCLAGSSKFPCVFIVAMVVVLLSGVGKECEFEWGVGFEMVSNKVWAMMFLSQHANLSGAFV